MRSLQRSMCAAVLSLEAVVMLLTTPVMISLTDVAWQVAMAIGVGLTVLCILVAGMLRRPSAYYLGWAIQIAAVALGFVIPVMFALGALFLALWWSAYAVGLKIDREKAAAAAAQPPQ
ncbi:MAG TPA: DUF4233 domain-containing protein [Nocardioidaceae bacterium]|nr:DUF4233 domain-containing protein [Nocardioidaceae bacterium]